MRKIWMKHRFLNMNLCDVQNKYTVRITKDPSSWKTDFFRKDGTWGWNSLIHFSSKTTHLNQWLWSRLKELPHQRGFRHTTSGTMCDIPALLTRVKWGQLTLLEMAASLAKDTVSLRRDRRSEQLRSAPSLWQWPTLVRSDRVSVSLRSPSGVPVPVFSSAA